MASHLPESGDAALERIWMIIAARGDGDPTLYAGGEQAALREAR